MHGYEGATQGLADEEDVEDEGEFRGGWRRGKGKDTRAGELVRQRRTRFSVRRGWKFEATNPTEPRELCRY